MRVANASLLVFLVQAFVNTFGITQPTPEGHGGRRGILWVVLRGAAGGGGGGGV